MSNRNDYVVMTVQMQYRNKSTGYITTEIKNVTCPDQKGGTIALERLCQELDREQPDIKHDWVLVKAEPKRTNDL